MSPTSSQPSFDISPEKEAAVSSFLRRQLFFTPNTVTDANLEGKVAIVTGSNTGVGLECARQLLDLGVSKLILAVRNKSKGQVAARELAKGRKNLDEDAIEVWLLDLLSYDSVKAFGEKASTSLHRLDIAILNAGILPIEQITNVSTGHDEGMQVNFLSTVLITLLLLPIFKAHPISQPGRITIVSSDGAGWTPFKEKDKDDILASVDKPDHWSPTEHNFVTKLLTQLFVAELMKHVPAAIATINLVTPGMVHDSELSRYSKTILLGKLAEIARKRMGYTSEVAARLVIDAAVNHGSESHGQYLSEQRLKPMAPIIYGPEGERVIKRVWDETLAEFSSVGVDCNEIIKQLTLP